MSFSGKLILMLGLERIKIKEVTMDSKVRIGIIGDYDGRPSHIATDNALKHSAEQLQLTVEAEWLPTSLFDESVTKLKEYDGLWCAPGSPYQSMNGAIRAIRFARENNYPFIGTCGGFQHAVIEFGRNVLDISELKDTGFDLYQPNDYIVALTCSLVGTTKQISLIKDSRLYHIYGAALIEEKFNCNFGLGLDFQNTIDKSGLRVVGFDEDHGARIMTMEDHKFYIITLFQPQLSSTEENPHPLVTAYLQSADEFRREKSMLMEGNR